MKRRYVLISDKQPNWKKEFYWKSLLKQIQDELPVKDVAEMVVDYLVFDQKILIYSNKKSEVVNILDGKISSRRNFGTGFDSRTIKLQERDLIVIESEQRVFFELVDRYTSFNALCIDSKKQL